MNKTVLFCILFFLAINTSFLWEDLPGAWGFIIFMFLGIVYFVLGLVLILRIGGLLIYKFKLKRELPSIISLSVVLILCYIFPTGIINSNLWEEPSIFYASREGAANCNFSISLKSDGTFKERTVCFSVQNYFGTYRVSNDTVYLIYNDKLENGSKDSFGIIDQNEEENNFGTFKFYRNPTDSTFNLLFISFNHL